MYKYVYSIFNMWYTCSFCMYAQSITANGELTESTKCPCKEESWLSNTKCRPTQSIMYVPLQVNTSQKYILLVVQYKYIKSCSGDFYSPESDPPHKIMRYWVYYSTQLCFWFPPDRICQVEMICIGGVPVLKRHFGGASP